VYADWLDERGDPRAEYLRLACRLAVLPAGDEAAKVLHRRRAALRPEMPPDWLAALGDHRSAGADPDPVRIEAVAAALGRPRRFVAADGYEHEIVAAARPMRDALAYVECRSRQVRADYLDINYHLRVRGPGGSEARWPIESYNPYFGCDVQFLEWYGAAALVIYREKHNTYVCRFGLGAGAAFKVIEDRWVLDGPHLGYRRYGETVVRRVSVPGLADLPPLSVEEAAAWDLVPPES
jgi:hypothetical protein